MATDPAEQLRDDLALAQAASRQATRARIEASLSGDPAQYQQLYDNVLPLVEFQQDMSLAGVDEVDSVVRNQNLDSE